MVSSDEDMHVPHGKKRKHHGKKRKHGMEDNENSVVEGARPKEIQEEKDAEQMALSVESEDRISQLPDHVIHHILSLFRNVKDAVRTRSLSKRWRTVWVSYAVLVFYEQKFAAGIGPEDGGDKEKMFRQYVADSLLKYIKKNLQIHKFLLHMSSFDLTDAPLLDNWLTGAFAQDLKELDLHIGFKDSKRYTLPEVVFISQTLTGLRLSGCILKSCSDIRLPHLQKLYLRKIHLAEHNVTNLISSCPSIEDLRLIQCSGLKFLFMCHPSLSRVEIHNCHQLKKVCIFAPDLDTFWFCGKKSTPCKVSLEHCKSLKKLTIDHPQVSRDFCKNQFDKFPVLEKLDLCISDKMKSISITGRCLQRIVLKGCKKLSYGQILAPKLASFELKGENMPYFDFSPFCLTDAKLSLESKTGRSDVGLGLTDAKLSLESKTGRSDVVGLGLGNKLWFSVTPFLSKFSREGFKLIMHSNKHIIIHEDLTNIKYPPLHDLNFEIVKSSTCVKDILNSLLRTLHPESVSIVSSSDSKFAESVYEMIKIKDEDPVCCRYNTSKNKCWRHFLNDVKFEDLEEMLYVVGAVSASEDQSTSTLYAWLHLSYIAPTKIINLKLSWNSPEPDVVEA